MLKFFRRIRRNLLSQGNLRKYLIYAIGEILLVMVGILLALQINNWNENRQKRKEQINLLEGMQKDLVRDVRTFQAALRIQQRSLERHTILRNIIYKKAPFHDSTTYYFASLNTTSTPIFVVANYERALREGLKIISNDSLRNDLVYYYEYTIPYMDNKTKIDPKYQFAEIMRPFYNQYLKVELDDNDAVTYSINNYPMLVSDNPFLVELDAALLNKKVLIELLEESLQSCRSLIDRIEKELQVLR